MTVLSALQECYLESGVPWLPRLERLQGRWGGGKTRSQDTEEEGENWSVVCSVAMDTHHTRHHGSEFSVLCYVYSFPHSHTAVWNWVLCTVLCTFIPPFPYCSMELSSLYCVMYMYIHSPIPILQYGIEFSVLCYVHSFPHSHTAVWNWALYCVMYIHSPILILQYGIEFSSVLCYVHSFSHSHTLVCCSRESGPELLPCHIWTPKLLPFSLSECTYNHNCTEVIALTPYHQLHNTRSFNVCIELCCVALPFCCVVVIVVLPFSAPLKVIVLCMVCTWTITPRDAEKGKATTTTTTNNRKTKQHNTTHPKQSFFKE